MAVNKGSSGAFLLLVRLLGLTGAFVAAGAGLVWYAFQDDSETVSRNGLYVALGGLVAVGIWLLCELPAVFKMVGSRRGAVGGNVLVQVAMAIVLVAGINVFAFLHFQRFDLTWDHAFTLDPVLRDKLANLRDDTHIVIVQRKTLSSLAGDANSDFYDVAASEKIVEKVKDLAEQFMDLGPRFNVEILKIQQKDFKDKVEAIRDEEKKAAEKRGETPSSPLADAIDAATENSIFFEAGGKVQRLAFHDVYQIDRTASEQANDKKGNLVLNYQGVGPFSNKILNVEEKKPRVAVAVVHPLLSMASTEISDYSLAGAKKVLQGQGFETRDLLLRKLEEDDLSPDPDAVTFDENRFEQIEEALARLDDGIKDAERQQPDVKKQLDLWRQPLSELQKQFVYVQLKNGQEGVIPRATLEELDRNKVKYDMIPIDDQDRDRRIERFTRETDFLKRFLEEAREQRADLVKERATLNVEELAEKQRLDDVEIKMDRMLADADLLVIPRITLQKIITGRVVPNWVHKVDTAQYRAIKSFLKKGKPVLFLLGPSNDRPGRKIPPQFATGEDKLEPLLAELGIKLPGQTILYNIEAKEYTERQRIFGASERVLKLPPVLVDWQLGAGQVNKKPSKAPPPHPIRVSLDVLARAVGKALGDELQVRYPRPVYVEATFDGTTGFDEGVVFLMANADSWNENNPFPNAKREPPQFTPTKDGDKIAGTFEEVRRGPFPIAVAVDRKLPESWFDGKEPTRARIGVIGSGDIFNGNTLNPIKGKLLLDVTNWLLGRDDLLATSHETWNFPRVSMSRSEIDLWHLATSLGLPMAFLFMGIAVWMVRQTR